MSTPTSERGARRAVAVIAAAALAGGVLGAIPSATAADGPGGAGLARVPAPSSGLPSGRYVVLLKAPAATQYDGSDPRYAATRVLPGGRFAGRSAPVQAYSRHLVSEHESLARSVGATARRHFTVGANGFVADLTGRQAFALSSSRDVLLVTRDVARRVDTWKSPEFLGLTGRRGVWEREAGDRDHAGDGVVVGVLDSGIWPESRSFRGKRLTRRHQTRWDIRRVGDNVRMKKADGGVFLGRCQLSHRTGGRTVKAKGWKASDCSTKIVGARYYPDAFLDAVRRRDRSEHETLSARDGDGHGSHTAGTAAGNAVHEVRTEGVRFGTASGMAPGARVAAYKVCFSDDNDDTGDCFTSSILEAVDDAVADGVDVISMSISGTVDTVVDPVEIAFEGAAEAGIFVTTSAGNSGPEVSSVAHNSPWLTTVAASTHVRLENTLVLGNGKRVRGASVTQKTLPRGTRLIRSERAGGPGADRTAAALCFLGALDPDRVAGKIVVCERGINDRVEKSKAVKRAGGAGMVLANVTPGSLNADFHSVPTIHVSHRDAGKVLRYLERRGGRATAAFRRGDVTGKKPTPVPAMAPFSSRGPGLASDSDLLKPDITGPGVSILAPVAPPANEDRDFDLYSGTSMAAPHVAGIAALIMGERTSWTPMQVKSALMTTATSVRGANGGRVRDPFAQGAGHVEVRKAFDPGLFITSGTRDWRGFLAGQGLPTGAEPIAAKDFNGPSMAQGQVTSATRFTRELIADRAGTWKVEVEVPGFKAKAKKRIRARGQGDRKKLTVRFTRTDARLGRWATGFVTLTGPTRLRLPVALRPVVRAPAEVSGAGVTGQTTVPVTAGFTGNLDIGVTGLAKAQSFPGTSADITVAATDSQFFCVQVAAGSKAARFHLDAANNAADMDMFVYSAADAACEQLTDVAGQSATPSADEQVTLLDPAPGFYLVEVDPFAPAPGEPTLSWRLDFYDVAPANQAGSFRAVPDPVPVTNNRSTSFQAAWTGLDPAARYLGVLEYAGALSPTFVSVDTSS